VSEPGETSRAAWLPIPSGDELPPEVETTIRPTSEKVGFVPN
jgi:hypothetical protein